MESDAEFRSMTVEYGTGMTLVTFALHMNPATVENLLSELKDKVCKLIFEKIKKKRSKDANALLWVCLRELANAQKPPVDKWEMYLEMLKKYGQYTFVQVAPEAVDSFQRQWRESIEVGEVEINGYRQIQMLCFYGSSTYTVKEFSILLDGVFMEMEQEGLQIPTEKEKWNALERWSQIEKKN